MYKFNLEPLLNHRRYQEEIFQKELAEAKKKRAHEQKKLEAIQDKKSAYLSQWKQRSTSGQSPSKIMLFLKYFAQLSKQVDQQKERIRAAEAELNLKRIALLEALKKRKTLEKIKEKRWQRYQQEVLKKERNFMDEVASRHPHFL